MTKAWKGAMEQGDHARYLDGLEEGSAAAGRGWALPLPEPSVGLDAYRRERERALSRDPRTRANYEAFQRHQRTGAVADYLPIKLDIENVSRCNFRCTMCQVSDWPKGRRAADMSPDAFRQLIDEQYGLIEIKLQGMGEPLMQRDDFFDMLRYARERSIWVRTTTNASLLHLDDNIRKLIDADPNEVQISIDGATKESFESIRRGAVFERVLENCKQINDYCVEKGVERTKMWTVVQRNNIADMDALVDIAAATGFRSMVFSLNLSDWAQKSWHERNGAVLVETEVEPERCFQLVEKGRRLGVTVAFWNVTSKYSRRSPDTLCPWPFERAYVASDMRVVPCCTIANPDVCELGPASELTATWNGAAYRAFRKAHLEGRIPKVCQGCYYADEGGVDPAVAPPSSRS